MYLEETNRFLPLFERFGTKLWIQKQDVLVIGGGLLANEPSQILGPYRWCWRCFGCNEDRLGAGIIQGSHVPREV